MRERMEAGGPASLVLSCRRENAAPQGGPWEAGKERTHPAQEEASGAARLCWNSMRAAEGEVGCDRRAQRRLLGRPGVGTAWRALLRYGSATLLPVLHCPCPRALLEEECRALEREIPILQVSCSPGPPCPQPFC